MRTGLSEFFAGMTWARDGLVEPSRGLLASPDRLEGWLYGALYLRGVALDPPDPELLARYHQVGQQLEAARRPDRDWRVLEGLSDGTLLAHKGDTTDTLRPGEYLSAATSQSVPYAGQSVARLSMSYSTDAQSGFCFFHSERPEPTLNGPARVRVYLNLPAAQRAEWTLAAIGTLDRMQLPYRLKASTQPTQRPDSIVVFGLRRHVAPLVGGLLDVTERFDPGREAPFFTRAIAPGVGLADEPLDGRSFGASRVAALAEALRGTAHGSDAKAMVDSIVDRFEHLGIAGDAPHLNPGLADFQIGS